MQNMSMCVCVYVQWQESVQEYPPNWSCKQLQLLSAVVGKASSAYVKLCGGMCQQNSSSTVAVRHCSKCWGILQYCSCCCLRCGVQAFTLLPVSFSSWLSYSFPVMEWPWNASPADGTQSPWVLVPAHLEAEQKQSEPLQHSGVQEQRKRDWGCEILLKAVSSVLRASCHSAPAFQNMKKN